MSLSEIELRVLGALVEKERTTPESYPLSSNALVLACNQKTSREPVSSYTLLEVEETLRLLADKGLSQSARLGSERVVKHQHRLAEAYDLKPRELAVLAVLMLRGPQTPGELRARTERFASFPDVTAIEASLARLQERHPPLVKNYGRGPGQSQDRWGHTLGVDPERQKPRVRHVEAPPGQASVQSAAGGSASAGLKDDVAALQQEIARLRAQVKRLLAHAGLPDDEPY